MHEMDDPLGEHCYSLSAATSASTQGKFVTADIPGHDFNVNVFPAFDFSGFGSVEPASLTKPHMAHDDSCIDKCTTWNPQGLRRPPPQALSNSARSRLSTSILPPAFHAQDLNLYSPQAQQFNQFYPTFSEDDFKLPMDQQRQQDHAENASTGGHPDCNFNGPNLCTVPQCTIPDDCASVACSGYTCSSQCCSTQVCQDESCGGGTPCDDLQCFDGVSQRLEWDIPHDWRGLVGPEFGPTAHDQACNHTNAEHDVAKTLRNLRAPDPAADGDHEHHQQQQQHSAHLSNQFAHFPCPLFPEMDPAVAGDQAFSAILEQHPELTYEPTIGASPAEVKTPLKETTPVASVHTCQWIPDGQDNACGQVFGNCLDLNQHLCKDHIASMSSKTKYLCLWKGCPRRHDQVFASRNKLRRHIYTHSSYKPFPCLQCGESFSAQQALDQHVRTHTGEKPFKCPVDGCDKSFKQKSALTMHIRTHTGEKPLKCEICGKCFCESSNLSKHRKTHNPEYKFKCDEPGCDSQFIRVDQLRRHQAKHLRQKKKTKVRSTQPGLHPDAFEAAMSDPALTLALGDDQLYKV